jgi:hypothetical protein
MVENNTFEIIVSQLRSIIKHRHLDGKRNAVLILANELEITPLDCAAALLSLRFEGEVVSPPPPEISLIPIEPIELPPIKMQRYRLDVGKKQRVDFESLHALLIEESGVDRNNIQNVSIRNDYTLLELPDEMPSDIFLHLKNIEINGYKLNIKRLKIRKETPYKSSRNLFRRRY